MHANEVTFSAEDKAISSMRNRISQANKRYELLKLVQTVAVGCTMILSSDLSTVAQEPTCGCEAVTSVCDGSCQSRLKKPKQLSVAQKFLKQFDRVGDEIEAQAGYKPTSAGKRQSRSANCGVETAEPTCGMESIGTSCGCQECSMQGMSLPQYEMSSPIHVQTIPQHIPSRVYATQTEPVPNQSQSFSLSTPPVKRVLPVSPMHPQVPPENQAIGKILDQPPPVALPNSVPTNDLNRYESDTFSPQKNNLGRPSELTQPTRQEPFTPRRPQSSPRPEKSEEVVSPAPFRQEQPTRMRAHPSDPNGSGLPQLPQPPNEIPDVLVDPFKDDVTWKGRRNQMNGIQQTAGSVHELPVQKTELIGSPRLKIAPVNEIKSEFHSEISVGPALEAGTDSVVTSSHVERMPVKVHTIKRQLSSSDDESAPQVSRTRVPSRK